MDPFLYGCQGLGLALAAGLAGGAIAGGMRAAGAGRMLLGAIAAIGAAILFGASLAQADHPLWPGWIAGAAVGLCSFLLAVDIVAGAAGRTGGERSPAGLVAIALVAALALAGLSLLISPVSLLALAAALWLAAGRRRRSQRKHEGLRVLR